MEIGNKKHTQKKSHQNPHNRPPKVSFYSSNNNQILVTGITTEEALCFSARESFWNIYGNKPKCVPFWLYK